MKFDLTTLLIITILILGSIIFFRECSMSSEREEYSQELGKQKTVVEKLKSDSSTISEKYATTEKDLFKKLQELNGKDTFIKRLFGEKTELEKKIQDQDLKIIGLVRYKDSVNYILQNFGTTQINDSTFIGNYSDSWVSLTVPFNYNSTTPKLSLFGTPKLNITNKYDILITEHKDLWFKALVQNHNPYSNTSQEVEFYLDKKFTEQTVSVPFYKDWKFYVGLGAGIGATYLILK